MLSDAHNKKRLAGVLASIKGPVGMAFSYQAEDAAVLRLLSQCGVPELEVFTLDTGKNFPETAAYHDRVEKFFGITIKRYGP